MKHASLFSGIGGFDLAAEWMGWENVFHCENNEFCKKILKYYWPKAISYDDIKQTDFTIHRGQIDILTGGFPCQPYSLAGARKGKEDDRHLWPEMLRAVREIRPAFIVAENVSGIITMENGEALEGIFSDLEVEGYVVEPCLIPAASVEAWHKRERIWIIAYNNANGLESNFKFKKDNGRGAEKGVGKRCESDSVFKHIYPNNRGQRDKRFFKKEILRFRGVQRCKDFGRRATLGERSDISTPVLCRSYDGIPNGVDRVRALGNAIVPQVAYEIFKVIEKLNTEQ